MADPTMPRWPATKTRVPRLMRSLVEVVSIVAVLLHELVALGGLQVLPHHLAHQLRELDPRLPAELGARLGGVAEERLHFRRAEIARVDRDDALAAFVEALLVDALALPADAHADLLAGGLDELAHAVLL